MGLGRDCCRYRQHFEEDTPLKLLQWGLGVAGLGLAMGVVGFVYERDGMIVGGSIVLAAVVLGVALVASSRRV